MSIGGAVGGAARTSERRVSSQQEMGPVPRAPMEVHPCWVGIQGCGGTLGKRAWVQGHLRGAGSGLLGPSSVLPQLACVLSGSVCDSRLEGEGRRMYLHEQTTLGSRGCVIRKGLDARPGLSIMQSRP